MKIQRLCTSLRFAMAELNQKAASIPGNRYLTMLDMLWCGIRYGAAPSNYVNFQFHRIPGRARKTYVTYRVSEKMMRRYNSPADVRFLYNKYTFSQKFAPYYGRKCILSNECTSDFLSGLVGTQVIYKPLRGSQGKDIEVFSVTDPDTLAETIRSFPQGVVETWIPQHPDLSSLYPNAINPVRVQTLCRNGGVTCLCATLTIGQNARFANASAHAIFALVDIATGTIISDGCDYDGHTYSVHPSTGASFRGFVIPNWQSVLNTVTAAALEIPSIGYIGWDVAITPEGCALIEGNNDPGYTAYQLPGLTCTHTGMMDIYKPYL